MQGGSRGTVHRVYWGVFQQKGVMLDFNRYEWLSFDCYGTLVDWETGIATAVSGVLESRGICMSKGEILRLVAEVEP